MSDEANRRRYPRIFLSGGSEMGKLGGVQAVWSDLKRTNVLDLSYFGAAIVKPISISAERGDKVTFSISFEGGAPVSVNATVVRSSEGILAVEFDPLSAGARAKLGEFLTDKMLGLTVRLVHRSNYGPNQDFTHWFHGPNDTNFFLWVTGESLDKAIVEIENQVLFWDKGVLTEGKSRSDLSSVTEDYVYNVIHDSTRSNLSAGTTVLKRAIEILDQARRSHPQLELLAKALETKRK